MLGCLARRHRPRREPRERALEGHRPDHAQRHRRDRGPPLLGARGARLARHRARRPQQRPGGRHHAGRLDADAAAGEEPLPPARGQQPLHQQEDRRGLDRRAAAGQVHQGRDPHGLSQHGLLRPERLRRRGRSPHVLRQAGQAAHAAPVGPAGGTAPGAHRLQPVPPPGCRAPAPQRGAAGDALAAVDQRRRLRRGAQRPARPAARQLRHRGLLARSCSSRCARSWARSFPPSSRRAGATGSTRPSISACSSQPGARSRTCSSRRATRRPRSSRSTCTTATCSRSAPPTTSRPPTSSTWRPSGTARRAPRSSCSRSWTRCAAAPTRPRSSTPPATSRSPRTIPSARRRAAGRPATPRAGSAAT